MPDAPATIFAAYRRPNGSVAAADSPDYWTQQGCPQAFAVREYVQRDALSNPEVVAEQVMDVLVRVPAERDYLDADGQAEYLRDAIEEVVRMALVPQGQKPAPDVPAEPSLVEGDIHMRLVTRRRERDEARAENDRLRDLASRLAAIAPEGVDDDAVAAANDLTSGADQEPIPLQEQEPTDG